MPQCCSCRGVEAICRCGKEQSDLLYRHLEKRCHTHIKNDLLPDIEQHGDSSSVKVLKAVEEVWRIWRNQVVGLQ